MIKFKKAFALMLVVCCCILSLNVALTKSQMVSAMPFYDLKPAFIRLRAEFSTNYSASSEERKNNISLAVKSLDNTFVDVGGEFSFNRTVGPRTEKRGYQKAKIIVKGEFVEGVGGGVCQVSTTLYNAVLLAGLRVTEYHPHSLPVSYVAPSFDAMVNSGSADLRFVNNTHNPVIIKAKADGNTLKIQVIGEPMKEVFTRKSVIKEYISPPEQLVICDDELKYPDLYQGEIMFLQYAKQGIVSEGILIKSINGKEQSARVVRRDRYSPVRQIIVEGRAIKVEESDKEQSVL